MRWLFLFIALSAHADEWKTYDKFLLGTAATILVIDWGQTLDLTNANDECMQWVNNDTSSGLGTRLESYKCRTRKETNPILGDYPSRGDVNRYFTLTILGTAALAHVLPQTYRRWFLGAVIVLETGVVLRNHQIGLRVDF